MSSLITAEWYMRKHFNGWARPFEFNAQHMLRCGHKEEARDTVRLPVAWHTEMGVLVFDAFAYMCTLESTSRVIPTALISLSWGCLDAMPGTHGLAHALVVSAAGVLGHSRACSDTRIAKGSFHGSQW